VDALADPEDAGDGRADLVADGREELGLEPARLARGELRGSELARLDPADLEGALGADALGDVDADGDAARNGVGVGVRGGDGRVAVKRDELRAG